MLDFVDDISLVEYAQLNHQGSFIYRFNLSEENVSASVIDIATGDVFELAPKQPFSSDRMRADILEIYPFDWDVHEYMIEAPIYNYQWELNFEFSSCKDVLHYRGKNRFPYNFREVYYYLKGLIEGYFEKQSGQ